MRSAYWPGLLLLMSATVLAGSSWASDEAIERVRDEALSDRTPGSFSTNRGTDFALIASEEGGRAVGRVTWAPGTTNKTLFSLEASAPLDEKDGETELLNLDGLAGGKSSVKVSFSLSDSWPRRALGTLRTFCIATNAALEHQLARKRRPSTCAGAQDHCRDPSSCAAASHNFERLSVEECTVSNLRGRGLEWSAEATKADTAAIQAGCDALAKILDDKVPFEAARRRFLGLPTSDLCTQASLAAAITEAHSDLLKKIDELSERRRRLSQLIDEATIDIRRARTLDERFRARERIQTSEQELRSVEAELAEAQTLVAKLKAGDPSLLETEDWLDKKRAEKLAPTCQRYNHPKREHQIVVDGDAAGCSVKKVPSSIQAIENESVRREFASEFPDYVPFNVWFLTFSAAANNRDFQYLTEEAASAVSFSDLESAIEKDTKEDTSVGVRWSLQYRGHLFGIGYEFRNKFVGAGKAEFCAPIESEGASIRCLESSTAAPLKIDQNLGLLEWRTYLSSRLGLRLRLYFIDQDFRSKTEIEDEWELQARLYFLRNKDEGLSGGIDIAYDTAFEDIGVRAFIGQSFSIFD